MDRQNTSIPPIPQGTGIKPRGWESAVAEVRGSAPAYRKFWDLWVVVYKRHLRRYAGSGGCPACGTVYAALQQHFDAALQQHFDAALQQHFDAAQERHRA